VVAVSHKVYITDLVHIYGWEALGMRSFIHPLPPISDKLLCGQKRPVELLVAAGSPRDLDYGNGLGADIVLSPDAELVTDLRKGQQAVLVVSGEKAQNFPEKDSASSLGKGVIGL